MKKFLIIVFVFIAVNQNALSQTEARRFTVQHSTLLVLGILSGHYFLDLEGQYKLSDKTNVSLLVSGIIPYNGHLETTQFSLKPMFIYRPFNTGLRGFYMGLFPSIGWLDFKHSCDDRDNFSCTLIGFGLETGYKWIFRNGFTMQLGTGIGKTFSIPERPWQNIVHSDGRYTFQYYDVLFDFKIGYSF